MPIKFRQLEVFRAVMSAGTITQAAEMLYVSQPGVSRMLAELEEELGFRLFVRTNRQIIPTEEAKALHQEVQRAFTGIKEISDAAAAIREYRTGQLNLVSMPGAVGSIMPQLLSRFAQRYPDVAVSLDVQPSQRVFEWMKSMQFDLGFAYLPSESPLIEAIPLVSGDSICLLPSSHALTGKKAIEPKDLAGQRFVSFKSNTMYRFQVDQVFRTAGVERRLTMEARSTEAIFSMVAAGLGVSIIPPFFSPYSFSPGVVTRPFQPAIRLELGVLRPVHKQPSRIAEEFLRVVDEFRVDYCATRKS
jgi:DNA-binding transcriptional LysR family regulator